MWPFKHKSEFSNMSSVHAVLLLLSALTLISSVLVLVKVKMLIKEEAKTRDTISQIQANMTQLGARRPPMMDRMLAPRPAQGDVNAPTTPPPAPAPAPKK